MFRKAARDGPPTMGVGGSGSQHEVGDGVTASFETMFPRVEAEQSQQEGTSSEDVEHHITKWGTEAIAGFFDTARTPKRASLVRLTPQGRLFCTARTQDRQRLPSPTWWS